ncbi:N-acetylmuramoyl-L-alanine amidase [Paractinoplanes bogorensis]|uniref:N-acetylmuramoyl-L-alanine amidase n=1 Tax=Paractinoplanes bogorensis TaxID=1610840 RepID=UPI0027E16AA2|nr:N-acetylmuramoyl-L-alanine amidase [Actinoplanes bogorensis]
MHRNRTKLLAASGLLAVLAGTGGVPAGAVDREPARAEVAPALQTVDLAVGSSRPPAGRGYGWLLPMIKPFSLIGVTWENPRETVDGVVQVRTRAAGSGRWTGWQTLETDGRAPGDSRGASDPLWVGASDGVEARMTGGRPPAGLRVDLINPDAPTPILESAATGRRAVTGRQAPKAKIALPARPVPRMVTRAGWRANEAIVKGTPEYTGPTQVFFVHHTATGNGYSCSQSASIVRGIQAYQVRSRGWDDIGYNFLVDKCGTVFEGRGGGVGRTVLGAHTMGFNADASSIAVIGNYGGVRVTPRVRTVIAAVAAYKLGAYGNAPNGRVVLTSGGGNRYALGRKATLWRIAGHRDAGLTACPGNALYAQLPNIRAVAGGAPAGLHVLRIGGTALAARRYFTRGLIQPAWTTTTPTVLINRFEVWVDGVLRVATPNSRRSSVPFRLTPGSHDVTVRALHLSGRSSSVSSRVIVDPDAPVFAAKPALALRPGTVSSRAVPLRMRWDVRDAVSMGSVTLTGPLTINLGNTARSRDVAAPPNRATQFTVRAVDRAGNANSASVTRAPWVVSEVSARRTGSWRALRNGGYLGGTAVGGSVRGASASWTFSGTSAALVFSKGPRAGRVGVFVDGRPQGMVDLRSASSAPRQVAWSRSWPDSGSHTVRVVVEGTRGRPGVALDGLVYLK